jgi:hypothetical protein
MDERVNVVNELVEEFTKKLEEKVGKLPFFILIDTEDGGVCQMLGNTRPSHIVGMLTASILAINLQQMGHNVGERF